MRKIRLLGSITHLRLVLVMTRPNVVTLTYSVVCASL